MARILVIDTNADDREALERALRGAKHVVQSCASAVEAMRLARTKRPDVVLLDLTLRDLPSLDLCGLLRGNPRIGSVRIIAIADRAEQIEGVVGLESGADDYLVKPFGVRALLAAVDAANDERREARTGKVYFGWLSIDRDRGEFEVDGAEVRLTRTEQKLLVTLFAGGQRVQSRDMLLRDVWGVSGQETRTVDTHVRRLRQALGPAGAYIETVRGAGYRFVASPDDVASPSESRNSHAARSELADTIRAR